MYAVEGNLAVSSEVFVVTAFGALLEEIND